MEGARGVPLAFAVEIVDIYCPRPRRNRRSSTRSTGLPMNVFTFRMAVLLNVISIGLSSAPETSKCRTGATGNGASYLGRCDPARRVIA